MVIEHAIRRANRRLAILERIPRKANARSHVVVIARNALGDAQRILRGAGQAVDGGKRGGEFHVVACPIV